MSLSLNTTVSCGKHVTKVTARGMIHHSEGWVARQGHNFSPDGTLDMSRPAEPREERSLSREPINLMEPRASLALNA
jgi:hypothetical protein